MALTPDEIEVPELFESEDIPSRTYMIDWVAGRIRSSKVDNRVALIQFVYKTLFDGRFEKIIYTDAYGNEIKSVLGAGYSNDALETELTRVIREALIYDERISGVDDFVFTRSESDLLVSFRVLTAEGEDTEISDFALTGGI